jgi:hypothetical protein
MRAASWDCHRSVLRNDTHAGRTLDPTARSEPIRCGKEYIAFRCRLKAAVPCGKKLWRLAVPWIPALMSEALRDHGGIKQSCPISLLPIRSHHCDPLRCCSDTVALQGRPAARPTVPSQRRPYERKRTRPPGELLAPFPDKSIQSETGSCI